MAVSVGHSHLLKASLHSGLSENALFFLYPILDGVRLIILQQHLSVLLPCLMPFCGSPKKPQNKVLSPQDNIKGPENFSFLSFFSHFTLSTSHHTYDPAIPSHLQFLAVIKLCLSLFLFSPPLPPTLSVYSSLGKLSGHHFYLQG